MSDSLESIGTSDQISPSLERVIDAELDKVLEQQPPIVQNNQINNALPINTQVINQQQVQKPVDIVKEIQAAKDLKSVSFKGTRFEIWESEITYNPNRVYTDPIGLKIIELVKEVSKNPTEQEKTIILSFFKQHQYLFDEKKSKELENVQETIGKLSDFKNLVSETKTIKTEITNRLINSNSNGNNKTPDFVNEYKRKYTNDSIIALTVLSNSNASNKIVQNLIDSVDNISLKSVLLIYKESENSPYNNEVFNSEVQPIISKVVFERVRAFALENRYSKSKNMMKIELKDIIRKMIKGIRGAVSSSLSIVNDYLRDPGNSDKVKLFNIDKIEKHNLKIRDLKQDVLFKEYVGKKVDEYEGDRKKYTEYVRLSKLAEKIGTQVLATNETINLSEKSIISGFGVEELKLGFFPKTIGDKKEGLYIGGIRYNFNGVDKVNDVIISGEKVVIKGVKFGEQIDLIITKKQFVEGIKELFTKKIAYFETIDGKNKFEVEKALI